VAAVPAYQKSAAALPGEDGCQRIAAAFAAARGPDGAVGVGPVPCLARQGQQHELTITRQRLATVNKRGGAALVRLRHLPNAARWTYSHTIVPCK